MKKLISKSLILCALMTHSHSNEFDPQKFSIENNGLYQETSVTNYNLGQTKARAVEDYFNTYRTNSFEVATEHSIPISLIDDLFVFIRAKGASQVGKHSDPYVEFFELNNEVQRNLKATFTASVMKKLDNQFFGFGLNEAEFDRVWYVYREQVSEEKSYIEEAHLRSRLNIGPSYGVVFDGADHYFFLKATTGYVIVKDDILDDQRYINLGVEVDYNFRDTFGLYGSYKVNFNSQSTENIYEGGAYLKVADFNLFDNESELRFKIGAKKVSRQHSDYQLDDSQLFIGLEFKF